MGSGGSLQDPHLNDKKMGVVILATQIGRLRAFLKIIPKAERAGGVVQVAEHLPSKCKVLCSNPSTIKTTQKVRVEIGCH
jgi:hypothetical protein